MRTKYFYMLLLTTYSFYGQWNDITTQNNPLCLNSANQLNPKIVKVFGGDAVVAWTDRRNGNDIYLQYIDYQGNIHWTNDGVFGYLSQQGENLNFQMIEDGANGVVISAAKINTNGKTEIRVQKIDYNGASLWGINGQIIQEPLNNYGVHKIMSDGSGGCYVIWASGSYQNHSGLFVQRITNTGIQTIAIDDIYIEGSENCTYGGGAYKPVLEISPDNLGGFYLVWPAIQTSHLYLSRVNSNGSSVWPIAKDISDNVTAYGSDHFIDVLTDSSNNVFVSYQKSPAKVITTKIDQNANTQWIYDHSVNPEIIYEYFPRMVSDGADGIIVSYSGSHNTLGNGNFLQRLSPTGTAYWGIDGILSNPDANFYSNDRDLDSDGNSGAILTYSKTGDIFVQKITSDGSLIWPGDGKVVSDATGIQQYPVMITDDSATQSIIAWADNRSSSLDIFCSRVEVPFLNNSNFTNRDSGIIYPNPANEVLNFTSNGLISINNATIYDVLGNILKVQFTQEVDNIKFDISSLSTGIYCLIITSKGQSSSFKFVKI